MEPKHFFGEPQQFGEPTREAQVERRELKGGEPLTEALEFCRELMEQRNEHELPTIPHRAAHLSLGGWDLKNVHERADEAIKPLAYRATAAKLMLRIVTALELVGTPRQLIDQVIEIYSVCIDCGKKPCICPLKRIERGNYTAEAPEGSSDWTLRQWQEWFNGLYGTLNSQRTLGEMVDQVDSEVREAAAALMGLDATLRKGETARVEAYRQAALNELAQSFAWLAGFCNHPDVAVDGEPIDLEALIVKVYGNGCPNLDCGTMPCTKCGSFSYLETRKDPQTLAMIQKEFF